MPAPCSHNKIPMPVRQVNICLFLSSDTFFGLFHDSLQLTCVVGLFLDLVAQHARF